MAGLQQWLNSKKLGSLFPKLKDEIDGIGDFQALTNKSEVDEFVNELPINKIKKKQLGKAILSLINAEEKAAKKKVLHI